jgi:hypothetical protein
MPFRDVAARSASRGVRVVSLGDRQNMTHGISEKHKSSTHVFTCERLLERRFTMLDVSGVIRICLLLHD